jgi:hypothetical protein
MGFATPRSRPRAAAHLSTPLTLALLLALLVSTTFLPADRLLAAGTLPTPEQFIGFKLGADNKLVRWEKILEYMQLAADSSDRVRLRELGKTNYGLPFVTLEISAPDTLKNLNRYKQLERKLYFQGGAPTVRERDEIFGSGKVVVLVTCSVHANEIAATQMAMQLVHHLATDESPAVKKILDNVVFLLVPSANPDGQVMITDWFNGNVGTPYAASPLPYLYHPYAGHDINRDMYMLTQKESRFLAELAWRDWLPAIWLDEHEMGSSGPRMFVMPAADPINPNVHPLIYRWNAILGQSQAAALEAAGKDGIIYNSTYTNFWQGALAWTGWWHNQIGLLTEAASVRIAAPVNQLRAIAAPGQSPGRQAPEPAPLDAAPLMPPTDVMPRTEYPRPWMGGRWTLSDIVDYEFIATMGLLETAADRRETILRQIYEINRQTAENVRSGDVTAILIPTESQHDPREAAHLVDTLMLAGVEVYRADSTFNVDGQRYAAGTFVIPMTQVFARYAKDLLERQRYPDIRTAPNQPLEQPYDVTAWSLGMLFGVDVTFTTTTTASVRMSRVTARPETAGRVAGSGTGSFAFEYVGADTVTAINRLLKDGARVAFGPRSQVSVTGISREKIEALAETFGLSVTAADAPASSIVPQPGAFVVRSPRVGLYSPWTGGNMDEGWTRWVLEQYEFGVTTIHNAGVRAGRLRDRFDAIILPDQPPREIVEGYNADMVRPEYRGGISDQGSDNLARFVADGGTLVTFGAASDLAIDRLSLPVRNLRRGLRSEEHYGPGTILRLEVDTSQPAGFGMAAATYGFYTNGPFFAPIDGPGAATLTVIARYPRRPVLASGWLRGEDLMAERPAIVSIEVGAGRAVLFGLRPQHRAQTHATFPLLFNALYLAASQPARTGTGTQ